MYYMLLVELIFVSLSVFFFRAKLAEWLASKGKTLKRPPISESLPTNSCRPAPLSKPGTKATVIAQPKPVVQPESVKPTSDNQTDDIEAPESELVQSNRSSNIVNTTLDLLDNSDMDLPVDPEIRMESVRIVLILMHCLYYAYTHRERKREICIFFNVLFTFQYTAGDQLM